MCYCVELVKGFDMKNKLLKKAVFCITVFMICAAGFFLFRRTAADVPGESVEGNKEEIAERSDGDIMTQERIDAAMQ